jgi:hypothetical protein
VKVIATAIRRCRPEVLSKRMDLKELLRVVEHYVRRGRDAGT